MDIGHHVDIDAEMADAGEGRHIRRKAGRVVHNHVIGDYPGGAAEADVEMRQRHATAELRGCLRFDDRDEPVPSSRR